MVERRHRFHIYFQILEEVQRENRRGIVKPTHLSYKVSVPFDRLKEYLKELTKMEMIDEACKITVKGEKFLLEYGRMMNILNDMGMLKGTPMEVSV